MFHWVWLSSNDIFFRLLIMSLGHRGPSFSMTCNFCCLYSAWLSPLAPDASAHRNDQSCHIYRRTESRKMRKPLTLWNVGVPLLWNLLAQVRIRQWDLKYDNQHLFWVALLMDADDKLIWKKMGNIFVINETAWVNHIPYNNWPPFSYEQGRHPRTSQGPCLDYDSICQ